MLLYSQPSLKEAIYDTARVLVLHALYASCMKNQLPKKNVKNKAHVVESDLGSQERLRVL